MFRKYLVINCRRCYFFKPVTVTFHKNRDKSVTCNIGKLVSDTDKNQKAAYNKAKATLNRYLELSQKPAHQCTEQEMKIRGLIFSMVNLILSRPPSKRKKYRHLAGQLFEAFGKFFFKPLSSDYAHFQPPISKKLAQKAQAIGEIFTAKFKTDRYDQPIGRPLDVGPLFPKKTEIIDY